jgi:hypothetical protein
MYCRVLTCGKDLGPSFFDGRYEQRYYKKSLKAMDDVKALKIVDIYAKACPYEKIFYKTYIFTAEGVIKLDTGGNVEFLGKKMAIEQIKGNKSTRTTLKEVSMTWEKHLIKGTLDKARTMERYLLQKIKQSGVM